nr:MAG TPA: hypothetical protein [Caudoviricetes sp.]
MLPCYRTLRMLILLDFLVTKGSSSLQKGCDCHIKRCTAEMAR